VKKIALALLSVYRNTLSKLKIKSCRYLPTCSEYTYEAIEKYGALKGAMMGAKRILRCNQLFPGGYDPVP